MEKNSITKLFEDVNIYEKAEFDLYTKIDENYSIISDDNLLKIYDYLGLHKEEKLITDCEYCGGRFPFIMDWNIVDDGCYGGMYVGDYVFANGYRNIFISFKKFSSIEKYKILNTTIDTRINYIDCNFKCTNENEHIYKMNLFLFKDKEKIIIIKYGQFPESTALGSYDSEKYKQVLRKFSDSYVDYKNAEKSYKYGLYSGAFTYLRRVLENMIDYYISKNGIKLPSNSKSEDRIDAVKQYFDEKIRDILKPLYSALSKGIHSIKDQECKEYYSELKIVLDIQLQYVKSNEEREQKLKDSSKALTELNNKYNGK